jgi:hypothetical protein
MHADEAHRVEPLDEIVQRGPIEQGLAGGVQADIDSRGLDVVDVDNADEARGPARFHHEAIEPTLPIGCLRGHPQHALTELVHTALAQSPPGTRHGGVLALVAVRLQQIVQRVGLERLNRMLVVSRHEDRERHRRRADGIDDTQAVELGHLDVEEHQVGPLVENLVDADEAVFGFRDAADARILPQEIDEPMSCRLLVVHDEHVDLLTRGGHDRLHLPLLLSRLARSGAA